jgi:probable addiction module antidote protein
MSTKVTAFDVSEYLKDESSIAAYLSAIVDEGDPELLLAAIGDIAKARGMSRIASDSGLGRESLYKALNAGAKPRFDTILKVLGALGVNIAFNPKGSHRIKHNKIMKARSLHIANRLKPSLKGASAHKLKLHVQSR